MNRFERIVANLENAIANGIPVQLKLDIRFYDGLSDVDVIAEIIFGKGFEIPTYFESDFKSELEKRLKNDFDAFYTNNVKTVGPKLIFDISFLENIRGNFNEAMAFAADVKKSFVGSIEALISNSSVLSVIKINGQRVNI